VLADLGIGCEFFGSLSGDPDSGDNAFIESDFRVKTFSVTFSKTQYIRNFPMQAKIPKSQVIYTYVPT
jgi:hypothetical protein